jgi:class 3 adenylate cyclase
MAKHAWPEALKLLRAADQATSLDAEGLALLGDAAWWTCDIDSCIEARERAYAAYLAQGDESKAATICLHLAEAHFNRREDSVGSGWLKRAERLLAGADPTATHGWLARSQAVLAFEAKDVESALKYARAASAAAKQAGDRDLEALSLHDEGRFLLASGEAEAGFALMEEATAGVVGNQIDARTTGRIYCNMIETCGSVADYRRASEWDEAAKRWCERLGDVSGFPGVCRVRRAGIMRMRGAWSEAEVQAKQACEELKDFLPYAGLGHYEVGEIRLRMGDVAEAERAFQRAEECGKIPLPGLAILNLVKGDAPQARQLLDRALEDTNLPLGRAPLLSAQVAVALAQKDVAAAEQAANELKGIADKFSSDAISGAAEYARGRVALGQARAEEAIEHLSRAWRTLKECDMPYESADARLNLGRAYLQKGNEVLAKMEIEAARSTFERLGAAPSVRWATELLGVAAGPPSLVRSVKALMFTDMVGSTSLIGVIGDEAWSYLVGWHDRTLRSLFEEHRGHEKDHVGDGFFVVFENASDALDCAIDIQNRLSRHRADSGFAPQVRIGLHLAEVTEVGEGLIGMGVHRAARISALAGPGEIVGSVEVAEGLPPDRIGHPKAVSVKGINDPVNVVTIEWR